MKTMMSKKSLRWLIIFTLSFCGCKRESSILLPSIADQIYITFLEYYSGDYPHPTCKFRISNESDHNIASNTNEIVYQVLKGTSWENYDLSEMLGNGPPLRFKIPARSTFEFWTGIFPPIEYDWRMGIVFYIEEDNSGILIWSDSIKITDSF